jgi:hypothetical protein
MHILLLIVYGALASLGIWKIPFLRNCGVRPALLWLLFALHVLTGWAHNWIAYRYFPEHGDIWNYFSLSFLYRHRLLSEFNLFLSDNSTWTYITHNGIVFIQMLLDLLSLDDMNINTLLFSFPVFLGNVALFRVFRRRFPDDAFAATTVFWLPSVLFWTACIYREGMLYMLLGFLFYHLDHLSTRRAIPPPQTPPPRPIRSADPYSAPPSPPSPKLDGPIVYAIILFLLIAYFRLAVAIILIPSVLVWRVIEHPLPRLARWLLGGAVVILVALTLSIPTLRDPLLRSVTAEQASFQVLEGHSRLRLPTLDGALVSVWRTFPYAIRNGFFEPLPGSGGQPLYLAFSVELLFVWSIVLLAAIRSFRHSAPGRTRAPHSRNSTSNWGTFAPIDPTATPDTLAAPRANPAFPAACLLFALAGMLTIGFFVPFAGTIIRYRSIYLPFLFAPALHNLRHLPVIQPLNRWLSHRL